MIRRAVGGEVGQMFRPCERRRFPIRKDAGVPPCREEIKFQLLDADAAGDVQVVLEAEGAAVDLRDPQLHQFRQALVEPGFLAGFPKGAQGSVGLRGESEEGLIVHTGMSGRHGWSFRLSRGIIRVRTIYQSSDIMDKTANPPRRPQPGEGKRGEEGYLGYLLRQAAGANRNRMEHALSAPRRDAAAICGADHAGGLSGPIRRRPRAAGAADPADGERDRGESGEGWSGGDGGTRCMAVSCSSS